MTADTVGGVWTYAVELARALMARRVDVHIATMGAALTAAQRESAAGIPLHESAYRLEWMREPWDDVQAAGNWLQDLEARLAPDVMHLNQFAFGALPFRASKVVVAHSCVVSWWQAVHRQRAPAEWDRYRAAVRQGLFQADLVVAPTAAMLAGLARDYGFDRGGVVIANGRHADSFRPRDKQCYIMAAGRLWDAAKNLEALEAVAPALPWPVKVAGSRVHPEGGVRGGSHVQLLGELTAPQMAAALGQAAIYALPARYEPFGLSALEAALCGCALVLGDIPSLREVWGEAALYVPPDDHARLRDTLLRLIADDELRRAMGTRARDRASRYTPERMAESYRLAYDRVRRGHPRGRSIPSTAGERACAS
ncbi:MAG TPA: glycosyltransferase family 4 protein [Casimicrobiaceae bacterium]|nr:glycosyltransferase family 4 protein [Casimicrobiaceae bacterium]